MAQEEQIIISDLLSYMSCNLAIYSKPLLIKSVQNFYTEGVITDALDILLSTLPVEISNKFKDQDEVDAVCLIHNYLQLIPSKNMPIFVCRNLNNLPDIESHTHANELEIEESLFNSIRKQQHDMKSEIREISSSIDLIKEKVQYMVHRAIIHHSDKTNLSHINLSKNELTKSVAILHRLMDTNKKDQTLNLKCEDDSTGYNIDSSQNEITIESTQNEELEDLFPPDEFHSANNNRTIKFETEGGHLLMTTSHDVVNFDDASIDFSENVHRIEVHENGDITTKISKQDTMECKDSKEKLDKTKPCYIIVDTCFDKNMGNFLMYRCYRCSYSTNDGVSASDHNCTPSLSDKAETYTCNFCSFQSSDVMILNSHLSKHNTIEADETYECVLCYFKTGDQIEYKSHLATHSWIKPFKCSLCSYKGYDEYRMKCHSLKHAEFKSEYECECQICLKICGTLKALKRHKMLHARKYDYQCQYCNITYKNKSTLANHVLSHTKEKGFSCSYCNRVCDSKYTLFMHEKVHFRDKTYPCSVCDMQFKNRNSRRFHILTKHPDLKPYKCDTCDASFTFKQSYLVHKNSHTENENRKVPCPYCNKKFKSLGYVKMHIGWIHQGSKPFKCSVCDFQSRLKSEVNKHEAQHGMIEHFPLVKQV